MLIFRAIRIECSSENSSHGRLGAWEVCYSLKDRNAKRWEDIIDDCLFELVEAVAEVSFFVKSFVKEVSQFIQSENGKVGVSCGSQQTKNDIGPDFSLLGLGLLGKA